MPNSQPLSRPHCFSGKLLTVEDLTQEQTYVIEKLKRHNRSLHGFGVVFGLRVTIDAGKIKISSGMALDCAGNEIVIPSDQSLSPPPVDWRVAFVTVKYGERCEGVVQQNEPSAVVEAFELILAKDNENRGHRHERARWLSCGKVHGLTVAKIKRVEKGWRVDRRYRPPVIK